MWLKKLTNSKGNRVNYKVYISKSAEDDLLEIYKYIYFNDNEENADKIYSKLINKISALQEFPFRGHIPNELKLLNLEDFLEIILKPYRIIYQIIDKSVFVQCVLDGRRDMQKLLEERMLR